MYSKIAKQIVSADMFISDILKAKTTDAMKKGLITNITLLKKKFKNPDNDAQKKVLKRINSYLRYVKADDKNNAIVQLVLIQRALEYV